MKGIVLAGGSGTRLHPITKSVSKQLLPVYDKPMVFYPVSVLMLAGIREILIISTPQDIEAYKILLGSGSQWGVSFVYEIQEQPNGLAEAFIIGSKFIGDDSVCLVLGDNIFWGNAFSPILKKAAQIKDGAIIFGYQVKDPERFGVIEFDDGGSVTSIEEKPECAKSDIAATGLYFFDNKVASLANSISPSERGELEITALNNIYLLKNELRCEVLGRGFAWLDTGTVESLYEATSFVRAIQQQQGYVIACLEEIAYRNGWITEDELLKSAASYAKTQYGKYISELIHV